MFTSFGLPFLGRAGPRATRSSNFRRISRLSKVSKKGEPFFTYATLTNIPSVESTSGPMSWLRYPRAVRCYNPSINLSQIEKKLNSNATK